MLEPEGNQRNKSWKWSYARKIGNYFRKK